VLRGLPHHGIDVGSGPVGGDDGDDIGHGIRHGREVRRIRLPANE
jgi:hypothetical protein